MQLFRTHRKNSNRNCFCKVHWDDSRPQSRCLYRWIRLREMEMGWQGGSHKKMRAKENIVTRSRMWQQVVQSCVANEDSKKVSAWIPIFAFLTFCGACGAIIFVLAIFSISPFSSLQQCRFTESHMPLDLALFVSLGNYYNTLYRFVYFHSYFYYGQ